MDYEKYLCCAVAAVTVILIGLVDDKLLTDSSFLRHQEGAAKGKLNYLWVAAIVLIVCTAFTYLMNE